MTPLVPVEIEWVDSCSQHGWRDADDFEKSPANCRTVGYLLDQTPELVRVVQSQSHPGQDVMVKHVAEMLVIPAPCVKRMTRLTEAAVPPVESPPPVAS